MARGTHSPPRTWRRRSDPLYRGDAAGGVRLPSPSGDDAIVRHILYLDGPGRETPYLSTSEQRGTGEMFAGPRGRVYAIKAPDAGAKGVGHIPRIELLGLLRGKGHGRAGWSSALEVMTARRYVEQWAEHLFDFSASGPSPDDLRALVDELFR